MIIQIPGVDTAKGLDLYDDDEDVYLAVLQSYVTNTPAALEKMQNVSAETLADYAVLVHGVKGTSTTIGAEETRKAALELENMATSGDLSGVLAKNKAFLESTKTLVSNIRNWLEQNGV